MQKSKLYISWGMVNGDVCSHRSLRHILWPKLHMSTSYILIDTSQKQDRSEFQGPQLKAYECLGQKEPHENPTVTVYRAVRLRDGEYLGTANNVESHPRKCK